MAMLTSPARLSRVTKRYGDIVALDGIDLDVRAGETVALLGPNGADKTTVVRTMLGLIEPTSGAVSIFGESPRRARRRPRRRDAAGVERAADGDRPRTHRTLLVILRAPATRRDDDRSRGARPAHESTLCGALRR